MIENPVDRGDRDRPAYFHCEDHGPLWRMPDVVTLAAKGALNVSARVVHSDVFKHGAASVGATTAATLPTRSSRLFTLTSQ